MKAAQTAGHEASPAKGVLPASLDASLVERARPLVHVGYHKTGTSWLQWELFNRTDRGFFPLTAPGSTKKSPAKSLGKRFFRVGPFDFDAGSCREDLLHEVDWSGAGCPVISNERLSGNPHGGGYDAREIGERLHATVPEARILVTIREQRSIILSTYLQYLQAGGACSLRDYITLKTDRRVPKFSLDHYRYDRLIAHYQRLFGAENVLVLAYETLRDDPQSFLGRLGEFSGAAIPGDLPFHVRYNRSISRFLASKTRLLSLFLVRGSINGYSPLAVVDLRVPVWRLKSRLGRFVPRRLEQACARDQRRIVEEATGGYYGESNRNTARLTGLRLADLGYEVGGTTRREAEGTGPSNH